MSVAVKVDENLPRQIADMLCQHGHDAVTVLERGLQGTPDALLWSRLQDEQRWLITADKGFADLRRHSPGSHADIILLRSPEENRRSYLEFAAIVLERLELDDIAGAIVIVTARGVRVRRAPGRA